MDFFNPAKSRVSFEFTVQKQKLQIKMYPTLDPNYKGRPTKGQKIFNIENPFFFSLKVDECWGLFENLDLIKTNKYVNEKATDANFKGTFDLVHYTDNKPTRLMLNSYNNNLIMTIMRPDKQKCSYSFRDVEFKQLKACLRFCCTEFPFLCDFNDGLRRQTNSENYKNKNNPNKANTNNTDDEYTNNIQEDNTGGSSSGQSSIYSMDSSEILNMNDDVKY